MSEKSGLFPGSFDPFTKGHEAVVRKSLDVFDHVVIGVGVNTSKKYMFSLDRRIAHIEALFKDTNQITVQSFHTLTVNFCKEILLEDCVTRKIFNTKNQLRT